MYLYKRLGRKSKPRSGKITWAYYKGLEGIQRFLALKYVPSLSLGTRRINLNFLSKNKQAKLSLVAQRHINVNKLYNANR